MLSFQFYFSYFRIAFYKKYGQIENAKNSEKETHC